MMEAKYLLRGNWFAKFIATFAKWDGLMFVKIVLEGYDNLKMHAFFPGFPVIVKILVKYLVPAGFKQTDPSIFVWCVGTGVLMNFILNLVNNLYIYR